MRDDEIARLLERAAVAVELWRAWQDNQTDALECLNRAMARLADLIDQIDRKE